MPAPTAVLRRRRLTLGLAAAIAAPALWLTASRAQPVAGRLRPTPAQTEGPF